MMKTNRLVAGCLAVCLLLVVGAYRLGLSTGKTFCAAPAAPAARGYAGAEKKAAAAARARRGGP